MKPVKPVDLERSLSELLQRLQSDPHVFAEIARARREFFGNDRPEYAADDGAIASALVRFGEWYALERESEVIGEIPLDNLQRRGQGGDDAALLEDSTAGVFLVERVDSRQAQVRDIQDQEVLDLLVEPGALRAGDLLVGRLYPGPGGEYIPSPVLGVHADGATFSRAFQRDIHRLGLDRRLTQVELEHLLFRRWATPGTGPLEHLEARLQSLLPQGDASADATEISEALRGSPQPGPVMGPILDRLAFATGVDLEALRRVLLEIWSHHASSPTRGPGPISKTEAEPIQVEFRADRAESLGQTLARRIEEGLARHEDIDDLFASVGEMLGEDLSEQDQGFAGRPVDDQPAETGDLEPLVREFLWENGSDHGVATSVLHRLNSMQREMPVPKTDIEYLESTDLQRLLLQIFLESPPQSRATSVRSAFEVLENFYSWAERTQEYELGGVLGGCHGLVEDVQRLHDASLLLSSANAGSAPCLMRVLEVHETDVGVQVHGDNDPVPVTVPVAAAAALRTGDLLVGSIVRNDPEPGTLAGMVVVVPGDLEPLLG